MSMRTFRKGSRPPTFPPALLTLALMCSGCGGRASDNRSPRAADAPEAYERAQTQAEEADRHNRAAERAAVGDAFQGIDAP